MSSVSNTILKFVTESPIEYITAVSVIYKVMEIDSTILEDELYQLVNDTIQNLINKKMESKRCEKLKKVSDQVNN